ncbi:hypothetical protein [Colwellia piezophila]|uniref:COG4648 family protein n=1 Tax=Colwellia piezophila TaxID=211668 RepID=UPI00037CD7E2|nr:hypothetical protein [Colwellia piezophila]
MKKITTALLALLLILYPIIVYTGLTYFEPRYVAIVLMGIFALRLASSNKNKHPWLKLTSILAISVLLFTVVFDQVIGVLLYPVAMNIGLLAIFSYSLYRKPSVIETLARLQEPDLVDFAVKYTEKVTLVWCLFFCINGSIALYTALFLSIEQWTLYNGLISYILMAILMSVEWLVRLKVKAGHKKSV